MSDRFNQNCDNCGEKATRLISEVLIIDTFDLEGEEIAAYLDDQPRQQEKYCEKCYTDNSLDKMGGYYSGESISNFKMESEK